MDNRKKAHLFDRRTVITVVFGFAAAIAISEGLTRSGLFYGPTLLSGNEEEYNEYDACANGLELQRVERNEDGSFKKVVINCAP